MAGLPITGVDYTERAYEVRHRTTKGGDLIPHGTRSRDRRTATGLPGKPLIRMCAAIFCVFILVSIAPAATGETGAGPGNATAVTPDPAGARNATVMPVQPGAATVLPNDTANATLPDHVIADPGPGANNSPIPTLSFSAIAGPEEPVVAVPTENRSTGAHIGNAPAGIPVPENETPVLMTATPTIPAAAPTLVLPAVPTATNTVPDYFGESCSLVRVESQPGRPYETGYRSEETIFTGGYAKKYLTPVNRTPANITSANVTSVTITRAQAEARIRAAFSRYAPDAVELTYSDDAGGRWKFFLIKDGRWIAYGRLSADTGDLTEYGLDSVGLSQSAGGSPPAVTREQAQAVAEKEIRDRNGKLPLYLEVVRFSPTDNAWIFVYRHLIDGYPTIYDGFSLLIDADTGRVVYYVKTWNVPEEAVSPHNVSAITRDAAAARVEQEAKACFLESADGFRIVSADLRWYDRYNREKFTPKPGALPLAWYITFDDAALRSAPYPYPQQAWVDAQNGNLLEMYYFHHG